jgi:DNA-directed RNA polymerase specialized sigma24 family protein
MFDFTEGVLKHADVLASYAHKLTQDKHNAQDLCQETLFKALANRDSFVTRAFTTHRAELKAIQSVIHEMPDILRIPIHLYSEGYKYQEIASITETAIGTTKSRIFMARQLLRKKVAREAV